MGREKQPEAGKPFTLAALREKIGDPADPAWSRHDREAAGILRKFARKRKPISFIRHSGRSHFLDFVDRMQARWEALEKEDPEKCKRLRQEIRDTLDDVINSLLPPGSPRVVTDYSKPSPTLAFLRDCEKAHEEEVAEREAATARRKIAKARGPKLS